MRPLLVIAFIIVGLILYKYYYKDDPANDAEAKGVVSDTAKISNALPVDIYIAREVNQSNIIYASGTAVPNEEVEIRSEASGRIVELNINEGRSVRQGEIIARLNEADLRSQLKKIEFEASLASQTEARQAKLLAINAISKEEYDMAVNKVNTLGADREFLEVQLEKTTIRAPFSGRMGLKNISIGAYITPNDIIANLVQTHPLKLDFTVPEKYASKIKIGQTITFSIDGVEAAIPAKIIAIDPKIDEDLRTLRVRATASNSQGRYLPGMFVRVELPLGDEKSLMIPSEAILPILKGKKVFVMKDGKATEAIITTGLRTDTEVQVLEGLSEGDSVVVSALMTVKEDLPIAVRQIIKR